MPFLPLPKQLRSSYYKAGEWGGQPGRQEEVIEAANNYKSRKEGEGEGKRNNEGAWY